jgi:23S rRNA (uracil1939-C5)-methyltransferase
LNILPEAVEDADFNARLNKLNNISFFSGDIKEMLGHLILLKKHGAPHTIITDPPRTGMHPDVVERILEISPSEG